MPTGLQDQGEILVMASFLTQVGYRDLAAGGNRLRLGVARRLERIGFDSRLLRLLWDYAGVTGRSQAGLFAFWMDRPSRAAQKLEEIRSQHSEWALEALQLAKKQAFIGKILPMPRRIG